MRGKKCLDWRMEQVVLGKQDRWPMMSVPCTPSIPRHDWERGGNNGKATPFPGTAQGGASLGERLPCAWNSLGKNTGVGCHALLQGIFPTQGSNPGHWHCRRILYHLSHQGSSRVCVCVCVYTYTHTYMGEGNGNPLQYSCLENPMDKGAWQTTVHGVAELNTTE